MGLQTISGYQVTCDLCSLAATPDLNQETAEQNAVAAGFKTYTVPPGQPSEGSEFQICPTCIAAIAALG